jgi:hypothetical protein
VQILVAESLGIGSRAAYYEESGAIRDIVQNQRRSGMYNWFRRLFARTLVKKSHTDMTITQGLVCKEVVELITDYLEGVLLSEKRAQLEEHVAGCSGCRNYLEQVRLTIGMLHTHAQESVFPVTKEELLQVFRQGKER